METALVLFSGGQDSTTCLYWALREFTHVHALNFVYGQRHAVETQQAERIAQRAGVPLKTLPISSLEALGGNALLDEAREILHPPGELPSTFVPGRNLVFFALAAAYAYQLGAKHLVTGVCATDYAGYPDCRPAFVTAAQEALRLAMDFPLELHAPLLHRTKAETWQLAKELGCLEIVLEHSHTCYRGDRTHRHVWGYGCGSCPACELRAAGYNAAFAT